MLYLRTFGALALLDGERSVLADQRRRLALLALLAGAGDRGLAREKVMALLWPESSTGSSRHALHQLLYYLRRHAHPDLFLGTDPLRLNPQVVESDVIQFETALAEGAAAAAVALYRGPFLDGFFLNDASEFEDWAESERGRLARAHTGALQRLARAADQQGSATLAIERWRELMHAGGLDPRAVLGLMRALAAAGDPAGALREARRYEVLVGEQLGEAPAPDVLAYARELRSQGALTPRPLAGATLAAEASAGTEPAFAGRYRLGGQAFRGGMATVYLATDLRHQRRVALKLLHTEQADAVGTERFLHEIRVTAQLQHPHILPVFDSGEAEGRLWFTTPWIEGESLRERLEREPRQPLDVALAITRQCLAALGHAHRRGVLHRDVKPENILLQDSGALLADFGIATVLPGAGDRGSAGGRQLTEPGVALGTPRYMSPEHAAGTTLDARSDLFSIGVVLFEMLAGVSYHDLSHAAHRDREIEALLGAVRPEIPAAITAAVLRSLQRDPSLRFAAAEDFADVLTAGATSGIRGPRRHLAARAAVAAVLAVATLAAVAVRLRPAPAVLDPDLLLVLPFRVAVTDTALQDLGEGALDLLHAKLQGTEERAMVEPHAAIAAWRNGGFAERALDEKDALRLGDAFGAGRILQGAVVGGRQGILITATLRERVGEKRSISASIEGPVDSLLPLFDRLAAELLVRTAGEEEHRLAELMTRSVPALRHYLAGQAAYRSGRYDHAVARFASAVEIDSTFALAGLGFFLAAEYKDIEIADRAATIARARRAVYTPGRLGVRDLSLLHYLKAQTSATLFESVALWEQAVAELPDRVEAWYELGDELFHWGARLSIPDAAARSAIALDRALAIDSAFAPALEHRLILAVRMGDTAVVRRLGDRYLAAYPAAASADYLRWNVAAALGDTLRLAGLRARFRDYAGSTLYQVVLNAQQLVVRLDDVDTALAVLEERTRAPGRPLLDPNAFGVDFLRRFYLHNRGHAHAAAVLPLGRSLEACPMDCPERGYLPVIEGRHAVYEALYWDGDRAAAARSADQIAARLRTAGRSEDARARAYADLCALEHWKLARRDTTTIRRSMTRLRDRATPVRTGGAADADDNILCAATLEVLLGVTRGRPDPVAVARLDSIQLRGIWPFFVYHSLGTLALARAREAVGDRAGALEVIRRREYGVGVPPFFTTMLREEGRLAAATGDTTGAIRAYRHYLALRTTPDPELAPAARLVRAALRRLDQAALSPRGSARQTNP